MNAQNVSTRLLLRLPVGRAARLPHRHGELRVLDGRVWLTRQGDVGDELLVRGDRIELPSDAGAVIEPYDRRHGIAVSFEPLAPPTEPPAPPSEPRPLPDGRRPARRGFGSLAFLRPAGLLATFAS